MFGNDRDAMRRYYYQSWQKYQHKQPLNALEQQIAQVIVEHPEYHHLLADEERTLQHTYSPEEGRTNPFLHMGLHLGIREQVATNRPVGILAIYQQLTNQFGVLEAEHRMMECLAQSLWQAQRNNAAPDEVAYMECLKKL